MKYLYTVINDSTKDANTANTSSDELNYIYVIIWDISYNK